MGNGARLRIYKKIVVAQKQVSAQDFVTFVKIGSADTLLNTNESTKDCGTTD